MSAVTMLAQQQGLTAGGWVMMVGCVGLVCGLCVFCLVRLMREPRPSQHHHAPLEIDTHDFDS